LDDIGRLVVHTTPTAQVRVADVAEVKLGALTRMGGVTHNGEGETVQGLVLGLRGADAQQVVAGVRARLEEVQAALPAGVKVVPFYDRGELVSRAVGTVSKALLEAVVLVGVMLYLFLGNLRAALAVAVVLPLSALWTFLLMHGF
ncbi:efflux RND transporter permease subunit, partial [Salmonella enterica subsp. enterica serovar Typhimurium]|nr:efflux RND transporter permease subunit [Salmonella enterica subsp. enterica serovar Typhimurium]